MDETLPQGAREDDFNGLADWTILELAEGGISLRDEDRLNVLAEMKRRGITDIPEEVVDATEDLAKNGYLINDGTMYYPTSKLREFISNEQSGPVPEDFREKLEDRGKITIEAVQINTNPERTANKIAKMIERIEIPDVSSHLDTYPGYHNSELKAARRFVENKETANSRRDIEQYERGERGRKESVFVSASEQLMVCALGPKIGQNSLLRDRRARAVWASKYDDYKNATDIIYFIENTDKNDKKKKWLSFSIDVTTSASPDENKGVQKKFRDGESMITSLGRTWETDIMFCEFGKRMEKESFVPHFILGLSEESFKRIAGGLRIEEKNIDRHIEQDIDFMIASELFEQIRMQRANGPMPPEHMHKINELCPSLEKVICRAMNLSEYTEEEFESKYEENVERLRKSDVVYSRVIKQARRFKSAYEELWKRRTEKTG